MKQINPFGDWRQPAVMLRSGCVLAFRSVQSALKSVAQLWLVTPTPNSIASTKSAPGAGKGPDPAKVEYLTTLTKHNGVVNCVRFAPFGASARCSNNASYMAHRLDACFGWRW